ncbi:MAG: hypothetical protein GY694_20530 [Gammaproteobacteria bacterium]|nr:hypothetical protein [Gammaproteobacteria bacterium]
MAPINIHNKVQTFTSFEVRQLRQSMVELEGTQGIRFINLKAYIYYLALSINKKLDEGKFVPRSMEEARAGKYLP